MEEQFPREDNNIINAKVFATCQGFFLLKRNRLTFRNCFAHLFFFLIERITFHKLHVFNELKQTTNLIKEKPRCKTILLKWKKYKANNT
jgi:hypothetical protein